MPPTWLLVPAAACLISAGNLLVAASQVDGTTKYSHYSVILLCETVKLAMALLLWEQPHAHDPRSGGGARSPHLPCAFLASARELSLFALPGSLYVLVNNLRFPILERVNPGVLAVVWNLKIVGVAGLLKCLLSRPVSGRQWGGIALLVLGSTLAEISQWGVGEGASTETAAELQADESHQTQGLLLLALGLAAVSVANVSCEHAYKSSASRASLAEQNCVLYSLGVLMNLVALLCVEDPDAAEGGYFHHFTGWTVAVILCDSVSGYLVGAMLRHIDAVAAIFADLASMLTTATISALFLDLHANLIFCVGFTVSCCSFWAYYGGGGDSSSPASLSSSSAEARGAPPQADEEKRGLLQPDEDGFDSSSSGSDGDLGRSTDGKLESFLDRP